MIDVKHTVVYAIFTFPHIAWRRILSLIFTQWIVGHFLRNYQNREGIAIENKEKKEKKGMTFLTKV